MSTDIALTADFGSEIRPLSEAEIDGVNGGFLPLLVAGTWLAAGFMWGMVLGDYLGLALKAALPFPGRHETWSSTSTQGPFISKSAVAGCSKNGRSRQCCVHTTGGRERADAGFAAEAVTCLASVCLAVQVTIRFGSMRQRTASRRRRARNDRARPGSGPPAVVLLHNVKQPAPRLAPRSLSRSRGACSASGLSRSLCLHRISADFADRCAGLRPKLGRHQLRPEPRGRRSAGRRTTLDFVAPVRRDATLARRSRPAQPGRRLSALHRGVCPKPAASPALPEPGKAGSPAIVHGRLRAPGAFHPRLRAAPDATSPLRLLDRLRKTPLTSEDGNLLL